MADNPQVRAGTAGGTITVVADEVTSPYTGDTAQAQGIKLLDGLANSTTPARVTSAGELVVNQQNSSTVSVTGTPNVHLTNAATVTLTGTNPVTLLNNGTVIQGTSPWIVTANSGTLLGQDGTVAVRGNVLIGNNGTVSISSIAAGDNNIGNVDVVSSALPSGAATEAKQDTIIGHVDGVEGLLTTIDADTGGILDAVQTLDNIVSGNEAQVDVVAALPAGDNNIGNVDVVSLPALTLTGTNPVFVTNNGTVIQGTNPWIVTANSGTILGQDGTVAVRGNVWVGNNGTVSVSSIAAGDNNIGNVDVVTLPGGITGFAEDVGHSSGDVGIPAMAVRKNVAAALAGADPDYTPLISDDVGALWAHVNDGTVAIKGNVLVGNNGTVSVTGTPNVHITNAATVTATDLDIRNLTITNDSITKGSATIGLGYTLGGTNILLTASGTVIPSVASRTLYVTHEAFTVQGGTVTITARNGDGGGTLWGPMQFSPTGGIAASLPIEDGALYETASGSAVYYVLAGSGTVGGRIRWARLAS